MFSSIMPKDYIKTLNKKKIDKKYPMRRGFFLVWFLKHLLSLSRRLFLLGRKQTNYATDKPRERLEEC